MNKVKLVILSSTPEDLWRCSKVANKVKKIVSKYVNVEILLSQSAPPGIAINGEEIVVCNQDDAVDDLLMKIALMSNNEKKLDGLTAAAGTLESYSD
jgi:hypothetical protein